MTIDEAIQYCEEQSARAWPPEAFSWKEYAIVAKWLWKLRERQETELRPATKFLGNTPYEQYKHIMSEVKEVYRAALPCDYSLLGADMGKLAEELVDLQMSCETMLAILGLDEAQRREVRRRVIEKNAERGYYEAGEDDG